MSYLNEIMDLGNKLLAEIVHSNLSDINEKIATLKKLTEGINLNDLNENDKLVATMFEANCISQSNLILVIKNQEEVNKCLSKMLKNMGLDATELDVYIKNSADPKTPYNL